MLTFSLFAALENSNRMIGEIAPSDGVTSEQMKDALKGSKYALLKPEEHLTEKQQIKLEEVKSISPLLATLHEFKESFREIFETSVSEIEGTMALLDWLEKAKETFTEEVPTCCRWFREITAYFQNRTTSGVVEGINNKLKLIKRSGYGFTNFERFRLRCLICWNLKSRTGHIPRCLQRRRKFCKLNRSFRSRLFLHTPSACSGVLDLDSA